MTEDLSWKAGDDAVVPIYALIGQIASGWSHIEQAVDITIWRLANVDHHAGACITAQIQSLSYRLYALAALADMKFGSGAIVSAINKFAQDSVAISKLRNRAIHEPIALSDDLAASALTIRAERRLRYGLFQGKEAEYEVIGNQVHSLLERYLKLDQEILAAEQRLHDTTLARLSPDPLDRHKKTPGNA